MDESILLGLLERVQGHERPASFDGTIHADYQFRLAEFDYGGGTKKWIDATYYLVTFPDGIVFRTRYHPEHSLDTVEVPNKEEIEMIRSDFEDALSYLQNQGFDNTTLKMTCYGNIFDL